jgi:AraC-like DNA-binding protein
MDTASIERLLMPITYGRHLARRFPVGPLLDGTGLTLADLEDRDRRITVGQALQYVRNAIDLAPEPDWYLEWASTLSDHFHGPISLALMSAPSLGDALDAFARYFPGRVPYLHLQGRRDGGFHYVELCPLIDLGRCRPLLVETPLIILEQYLDMAYGVDFSAARIELDYPATFYADRYGRYFKSAVRFDGSRCALAVPEAWLARRNLDYLESSWAHAIAQCEATLSSPSERNTLADVRRYLSAAYATPKRMRSLPTLDEVAQALRVAPRTLIRRLRGLGTSYQDLTDEFLKTRAVELLGNDGRMVKEVAAELGFSNPANFGKAFKRWYGTSPGGYRARWGRPEAGAGQK